MSQLSSSRTKVLSGSYMPFLWFYSTWTDFSIGQPVAIAAAYGLSIKVPLMILGGARLKRENCALSSGGAFIASSPDSPNLFNIHEKRGGAWYRKSREQCH